MVGFKFKDGRLQVSKENKEAVIKFIAMTGLTKEQILEEIDKSGYSSCYFCISPKTLQYWIEPIKQQSVEQKEKESMLIRLYGTDTVLMGKLRTEVFKEFLNSLKKKYPARPHPDGYISTCLFCGVSKLLINKFTGTTFCYGCRRELPFEYLFEILKGCDIFSIVQEIQNQQIKRKAMKW
jgi:hypothetical protein